MHLYIYKITHTLFTHFLLNNCSARLLKQLFELSGHELLPDGTLGSIAEACELVRRCAIDADHQSSLLHRQKSRDCLHDVVAGAHIVMTLHRDQGTRKGSLENVDEGNGILAVSRELGPVELLGEIRWYSGEKAEIFSGHCESDAYP